MHRFLLGNALESNIWKGGERRIWQREAELWCRSHQGNPVGSSRAEMSLPSCPKGTRVLYLCVDYSLDVAILGRKYGFRWGCFLSQGNPQRRQTAEAHLTDTTGKQILYSWNEDGWCNTVSIAEERDRKKGEWEKREEWQPGFHFLLHPSLESVAPPALEFL